MALRLPRAARLLRPAEFTALRRDARRYSGRSFGIDYKPSAEPIARLGMAVSRRVSKRAVVRNRIRRIIRESFRANRAALPACDYLVIARVSALEQTGTALRQELDTAWRKLATLKPERTAVTMPADS